MCNFITHSNLALLAQNFDNRELLLGRNLLPYGWWSNMSQEQVECWGALFKVWGYSTLSQTLVMQLVGYTGYERFVGTFLWNGESYGLFFTSGKHDFFWAFPEFDVRQEIMLKNRFITGLRPYSAPYGGAQLSELEILGEKLAAQAGQSHAFRVLLPWGELFSAK